MGSGSAPQLALAVEPRWREWLAPEEQIIAAVAYDTPIPGYKTNNVNSRQPQLWWLWRHSMASGTRSFHLKPPPVSLLDH